MFSACTLAAVASTWAGSLEGALVKYDLETLCAKSSRIVRGSVVKVESYWGMVGKVGPVILSDVTIEVGESLKGPAGKRVTVQILGGRIGERWQYCAESPVYSAGEEVLVFARNWKGRLWTTGWIQGKYRLEKTGKTGNVNARIVGGRKGLPIASRRDFGALRAEVKRRIARRASSRLDTKTGAEGAVRIRGTGAVRSAVPRKTLRAGEGAK